MNALLFLADGFEEIEALSVVDILRRAGVFVSTCSIMKDNVVKGAHDILVTADLNVKHVDENKYDAFILPGGMPGAKNLKEDKNVIKIITNGFSKNKLICAICAAPIVLLEAGILKGKKATSYPGFLDGNGDYTFLEDIVVVDENIITSRGPATAPFFAFEILEKLKIDTKSLKEAMLYNLIR